MRYLSFIILAGLWGMLYAQEVVPFKSSNYYKGIKGKIEILSEDYADMDGDNLKEIILFADQKGEKKSFVIIKSTEDRKDYKEVFQYKIKEGFSLEKYEIDDINGDKRSDLLIWLKDDSPDETGSHLIVIGSYGSVFKKMFEGSYYFSKVESESPQEKVIKYGELKEGINLVDEDKNGSREILIPREKKQVYFSHTKPPVTIVYGGLYDIYRYKGGTYIKDENPKVVNFLTPVKIKTIEASSEFSQRPVKVKKGEKVEPQILYPATWAADGNIGSSWSPDPKSKKGKAKDSIRFEFDGNQFIKAMILVPGCMDSEDSWIPNNKITSFTIRLSNGTEAQITRGKFQNVSSPVLGVIESPRAETQGAFQYMIFFEENTSTYSIEILIDQVEKGKEKGTARTCIAETLFFQ